MTSRPTLTELVAAVDERLRELGWEQPYPDAPYIWRHADYGVWSHDSAVGIAVQVEPARPMLELAHQVEAADAADAAGALELERVYGSTKRPGR